LIPRPRLRKAQVYGAAGLCLAAGLAIGYVAHGPDAASRAAMPTATESAAVPVTGGRGPGDAQATRMPAGAAPVAPGVASPHAMGGRMPSLEQMKQMADKQAGPLLEKLKADPTNSALLVQVGAIYHSKHQFGQAAVYYRRAAQADPKNVAIRTKLASSLYRSGDVNGAIAQLNHALAIDPDDANALFDLGVIRLEGKQDGKGAVAAWQKLLKANPQLSSDRRATVQKLMANVLTTLGDQQEKGGVRP
jgi:cytochrome c-type biogenesis protein CcmH/NrfG